MTRRAVMSCRTSVALVALLAVLAVMTSAATAADVTINGAGATLPQTILATGIANNPSYISTFQTLTNNRVAVTYNGTGSNIADDLIVHGGSAIDFGVSDAPLTDAEMANLHAPVLHIPITLTALEFIYNLPDGQISGPLNLTADVVARIYMRQITKWDDPAIRQSNPRLTYDGPITAVVRSDGSGSTYVVSEFLSLAASVWPYGTARTIKWPAGVTPALYTSGMVTAVKAAVGAIGYARWGVAAESGLQGAQLKNSAGYWTRPSAESVLAPCLDHSPDYGGLGLPGPSESWAGFSLVNEAGHSTYPLVTFSYALVYKDMSDMGERGAAVLNLLHFINLESTQNQALAFHFVPLPLYVRQANEKTLQSATLAFGNSPLQYYNPYVAKGGNRTAAILSLILSLLIVLGLLALIAKEIHAHFGQDPSRGIY